MSEQTRDPAELDLDLTASEFQDYDGDLSGTSLNLDFSQLLSAASLRALAAIVVSLLILQVPDRSPSSSWSPKSKVTDWMMPVNGNSPRSA